MHHLLPAALGFAFALAAMAPAADWPHWRGPNRNDRSDESSHWTGKAWLPEKPAWTAKVGEGASSPIIVGDNVYLLGHASGRDVLRCINARDGEQRWAVDYRGPKYGRFHMGDEGLYSGPSSTPEYDTATGFIYTLGVDGDLNCWDVRATGKKVWGRKLYDDYQAGRRPKLTRSPQRDYGYTSSPMVHGDWLLVEVGSTTRGTLIAFDKRTGKELWASELKDEAGHTGGPAPMTIEGVPCVALLTQRNLAVIRLDKGQEGKAVATFPWVTDFANTIAGPAIHENFAVITAGYNHNAICKVKVTLRGAEEVWRTPRISSKVCTPVIHDGHVYLVWQRMRCLNFETGELEWEGGRFGDPGSCIVTADGRVITYGQNGKLALIEGAGRSPGKYVELALRDQIHRALAWPHVVLANGRLYCRDREGNLAVFALGK